MHGLVRYAFWTVRFVFDWRNIIARRWCRVTQSSHINFKEYRHLQKFDYVFVGELLLDHRTLSHSWIWRVGLLHKNIRNCWIFFNNHVFFASIYWRTSLLHGVVCLTAAYRPIDGICLEQFVYGRSSNSRFIKIYLKDQSLFFSFCFCRHTVSPVQHLRKIRIPKCPPTDNRNKICLPMARRRSKIVRRAIQRMFKLKKLAFDAEKKTHL